MMGHSNHTLHSHTLTNIIINGGASTIHAHSGAGTSSGSGGGRGSDGGVTGSQSGSRKRRSSEPDHSIDESAAANHRSKLRSIGMDKESIQRVSDPPAGDLSSLESGEPLHPPTIHRMKPGQWSHALVVPPRNPLAHSGQVSGRGTVTAGKVVLIHTKADDRMCPTAPITDRRRRSLSGSDLLNTNMLSLNEEDIGN